MDLNMHYCQHTSSKIVLAVRPYNRCSSGSMIPEPDMVLDVSRGQEQAEGLSYQDLFSYREVYSPDMGRVDHRAKRSLNDFLNCWLRNLIVQGHRVG